jgi:hypothetical protein
MSLKRTTSSIETTVPNKVQIGRCLVKSCKEMGKKYRCNSCKRDQYTCIKHKLKLCNYCDEYVCAMCRQDCLFCEESYCQSHAERETHECSMIIGEDSDSQNESDSATSNFSSDSEEDVVKDSELYEEEEEEEEHSQEESDDSEDEDPRENKIIEETSDEEEEEEEKSSEEESHDEE